MAEPRLLDQVRDALRVRHYRIRTEQSHVPWIKRYTLFHGKRHPNGEVSAFLLHLASEKNVAASTQNQALAAILFLYKQVLHQEPPWLEDVTRVTAGSGGTTWTRRTQRAVRNAVRLAGIHKKPLIPFDTASPPILMTHCQ
jgi:hypothetical protein